MTRSDLFSIAETLKKTRPEVKRLGEYPDYRHVEMCGRLSQWEEMVRALADTLEKIEEIGPQAWVDRNEFLAACGLEP